MQHGEMSTHTESSCSRLPSPNTDKLTVEVAERINEVINQKFEHINEGINQNFDKFEQKFETMFQAFMERSKTAAATVTVVEERVKIIKKVADKNHRHVGTLDNTVVQIDKKVVELKQTLTKRVETYSRNFISFKREQTVRAGEVKKHMILHSRIA